MKLPVLDPADVWGSQVNGLLTDLAGPRIAPTTAHAKDDEFDGTSTATWIATPTAPTTIDANTTVAGSLYVKALSSIGTPLVGRLQTIPAGSWRMETCILDTTASGSHTRAGGLVLSAGATNGDTSLFFGLKHNGGLAAARINMTLGGSYSSELIQGASFPVPFFVRVTWNATTSQYTWEWSRSGRTWSVGSLNTAPGFTPTHMGLAINSEGGADNVAIFDYFRVTAL